MNFRKIINFLDKNSDEKNLPRFVTKNGLKFMIRKTDTVKQIALTKKLELKHQC